MRGQPGRAADAGKRRYYIFPYDWRQDNVVTARKLDALIEQIRKDYGDPRLKVDIVAHSMGGLITRYYIQYGVADVLDDNEFPANFAGADKIRTAVLLGTPNLGSVSALHSLLAGYHVGGQAIPVGGTGNDAERLRTAAAPGHQLDRRWQGAGTGAGSVLRRHVDVVPVVGLRSGSREAREGAVLQRRTRAAKDRPCWATTSRSASSAQDDSSGP